MEKEIREKVLEALRQKRQHFEGSDAKFSTAIGISSSQYSRIINGETDRVLSDANWITLARQLGVCITGKVEWLTAETPVFQFITAQLEFCQENSASTLLVDCADIGKTHTAMHYCATHKNCVYIDCSQVKSKQRFIRKIARSFGVSHTGRYVDVYDDLAYYIKTLKNPLIVLDEAGDLQYDAFLEIKGLWNATERSCGWYMMGADGLRERMQRSIDCKKVGYTEIFSRFGMRYGSVIPIKKDEKTGVLRNTALRIIKANAGYGVNIENIYRKTLSEDGFPSLRSIRKELEKTTV